MTIIKRAVFAVFLSVLFTSVNAVNYRVPKMYMFGFAASFNDSIVHFTSVQTVDSVWIDQKTKLMAGRENYSYQLRDYLATKNMPHRTCVVFYNLDRKKIEKKYLQMKRIYTLGTKKARKQIKKGGKINHYDIRNLTSDEFKFHSVDMSGAVYDE